MRNVLQEIADEQQAALRARIAELEADLKTQQAALKEAVGYFNAEKERSEELERALRRLIKAVEMFDNETDGGLSKWDPAVTESKELLGLSS